MVLQNYTSSVLQGFSPEFVNPKSEQGPTPVHTLGHAGPFVEVYLTQRLHDRDNALSQRSPNPRHPAQDDLTLFVRRGVVDP